MAMAHQSSNEKGTHPNHIHAIQRMIHSVSSSPVPQNIWISGGYGSGKTHSFMALLYPQMLLQEYEDGTPLIGERLDNLCALAETLHGEYQTRKMLLDCGAVGSTLDAQRLQLHKIEHGGLMLLDLMQEASSS